MTYYYILTQGFVPFVPLEQMLNVDPSSTIMFVNLNPLHFKVMYKAWWGSTSSRRPTFVKITLEASMMEERGFCHLLSID